MTTVKEWCGAAISVIVCVGLLIALIPSHIDFNMIGVDTARDVDNCGALGVQCTGENPVCHRSSCLDLANDPHHCGEVHKRCQEAEMAVCVHGKCLNLDSNVDHCGAVERWCPTALCLMGRCVDSLEDPRELNKEVYFDSTKQKWVERYEL